MFTADEKEARHRAFRKILQDEGLRAILLIGDTNVGPAFNGDLRYYTNNRVPFYRQLVVVFPDSEPVLFAWNAVQRQSAALRSFVSDCRQGENIIGAAAQLLKERGISTGKIGISFEVLSTAWYLYLKQELPQIEWVEAHDKIMGIRTKRSQEEALIFRRGAALGDGGYEAALRFIRPGVSEYEIAAEIEHFARARGAEDHFTLIGSGKFPFGYSSTLPLSYPSSRRLEPGDIVAMEITPRHEGYWTQLVRTITLGKPGNELEQIQKVCVDAIKKGLEQFGPGKRVKDAVLAMESYVKDRAYRLILPVGHVCGVDLSEALVTFQNEMVLTPGTAVIVHPTVSTPDGKYTLFWGETYLITGDGYERLHRAGDELHTL